MTRLLLVGANSEMFELARSLGHDICSVVDTTVPEERWRDYLVLRTDRLAVESGGFDAALLAIDSPSDRAEAYRFYTEAGVTCISLSAGRISETAICGTALMVHRGAHLSADCVVGVGVRLNYGANVMHDSTLGDFTTIAPNAVVLGCVTIGAMSYVGANATILPGLKVGVGCTVGAGAVVTCDVPDGNTVMGIPAR
jgi:sugar O-acyltransferase (sialic acid O-acetyltransferase NeuD family)